MPDIDIDFADREGALSGLPHIAAFERRSETDRRRHISGVYFQNVPVDPIDNLAVWDYREAENRGYFKIDFLNNTIYEKVRDENHLVTLLTTEPPWDILDDPEIVGKLAHIRDHFDVVRSIQPKSIEDLAVCIALPRPGKKHLIGKPRTEIDKEIWSPTDKYYYKKSHAISYASAIVVQLNLLIEEAWNER